MADAWDRLEEVLAETETIGVDLNVELVAHRRLELRLSESDPPERECVWTCELRWTPDPSRPGRGNVVSASGATADDALAAALDGLAEWRAESVYERRGLRTV
jgi:hypothetical protein